MKRYEPVPLIPSLAAKRGIAPEQPVLFELHDTSAMNPEAVCEMPAPLQLPESLAEHREKVYQRDLARQAFYDQDAGRPRTAYEELGGGLMSHRSSEQAPDEYAVDSLLRQYQPWQRDIRLAVETFGLLELTPDMVERMRQKDRQALALHFDGYIDRIKTHHRLIAAADGDIRNYELLEKSYGAERTPEEMIHYMLTLESLYETIRHMKVPHILQHLAHEEEPHKEKRARRLKADKLRHGGLQVAFRRKPDGDMQPVVQRDK